MTHTFVSAKTGETTVDYNYVLPVDLEYLATTYRAHRNKLLSESDWTMVPDSPVNKIAWAEYRQALRDITDQEGFPQDVVWPVAPDA